MASVDELSSQIEALKSEIEQSAASAGASMSGAEELSNQTQALGMESKAAEAMQVKEGLEQIQNGLQGIAQQAEGVRAQVEAMRGLKGGTGGGVAAGGAQEATPTPAGATGGGQGPTEPPKDDPPAAGGFEPEDFDFDLFGDSPADDQIVYSIGETPPAPDAIDPEEPKGDRLDRMRQGLARGLGDLKDAVQKGGDNAADIVSDHYNPLANATTEVQAQSGPDPVVAHGPRPLAEGDPQVGPMASTLLAMTVFGVEVAGKVRDAIHRRRG